MEADTARSAGTANGGRAGVGAIHVLIFDLDGTLYEDPRVYDRYVEELASRVPAGRRDSFLDDWAEAKAGQGAARLGLGYDAERDLLFEHDGGSITAYLDWHGRARSMDAHPREPHPDEPATPTEVEILGPGRFNIGDWWGLSGILAAHHGLDRDDIRNAFMATRAWMDAPEFDLLIDGELMHTIKRLHDAGKRLIAMSNSPQETVARVFDRLGVRTCFEEIVAEAGKPFGLAERLPGLARGQEILSIGDNFVNDIRPVLRYGGFGLYVDRHWSGLGKEWSLCTSVPSLSAGREWLETNLL